MGGCIRRARQPKALPIAMELGTTITLERFPKRGYESMFGLLPPLTTRDLVNRRIQTGTPGAVLTVVAKCRYKSGEAYRRLQGLRPSTRLDKFSI